jgi:hypothetical protein
MPLLQLSTVGYEDAPQRAPQADLIMGHRSTYAKSSLKQRSLHGLSHLVAGGTFFSAIGHRLHNTGGHPTKISASGAPP